MTPLVALRLSAGGQGSPVTDCRSLASGRRGASTSPAPGFVTGARCQAGGPRV